MSLSLIYSASARRALHLAEAAHRGTNRKGQPVPYILHPVVVAQLVAAAGGDEDMICAAYLHDVVEDTDEAASKILDEFGFNVYYLVAGVTKNDKLKGRAQKDAICDYMENQAGGDVVALKAADLIANVTDLVLDFRYQGWDALSAAFKDLPLTIEHYNRLAPILIEKITQWGKYPLLAGILTERMYQLTDVKEAE